MPVLAALLLVACGGDRTDIPPPPAAPPAAPSGSPITQAQVAPSVPVELPIPAEALLPPTGPTPTGASGPLRPAEGLLLARGGRRPRIAVGTSGAIVAYGRGTATTPPAVAV